MINKKVVTIPIYNAQLTVYIIDSYAEIAGFSGVLPESYREMSGAMVVKPLENKALEYMMIFERTAFPVGDIAHECLHLIRHIFQDIGATFSMDNDEPQCYLMGFLFDKVHTFIAQDAGA